MNSRQGRIQELSRINRRRIALLQFLAAFSKTLGEPIEESALLSVEDSESLFSAFGKGYQSSKGSDAIRYQMSFTFSEKTAIFNLAGCVGKSLIGEEVYFFTRLANDQEAFKVNASTLLERAEAVIDFDRDSLSILSADRLEGLLIGYNEDDPIQTFEVAVWGRGWPLLMLACDHRF